MFNLLDEAKKILAIHSISQYGNEEISQHLEEFMKRMDLKTTLQEVTHSQEGVSKKQFNIIGILGDPLVDGSTKKGLLLASHTDTVSHGLKTNWSECGGNPFDPVIKENKIVGLGAADSKLDLLCKLKACEKFIGKYMRMPVYVVGTAAEEIGMLGANFLVKSQVLNPKYVLVGEATELAVVYEHKAQIIAQISIRFNQLKRDAKGFNTRLEMKCIGRSAHSCHPESGQSAIKTMFAALKKIKESNFQIRVSRLMGGDFITKVPDAAAIEFFIQSSSFDDFKKFYREKFKHESYANKIQVEFGGLGDSGIQFLPDTIVDALAAINSEMNANMNFGRISQGSNSVDLQFDLRLPPETPIEQVESGIRGTVESLNSRYPALIMKMSRVRWMKHFSIKVGNELVIAAQKIQRETGINSGLAKTCQATEASVYHAAGFDTVVFGPGRSAGNIHSPNECNFIDQLEKATEFYEKMIEKLCL